MNFSQADSPLWVEVKVANSHPDWFTQTNLQLDALSSMCPPLCDFTNTYVHLYSPLSVGCCQPGDVYAHRDISHPSTHTNTHSHAHTLICIVFLPEAVYPQVPWHQGSGWPLSTTLPLHCIVFSVKEHLHTLLSVLSGSASLCLNEEHDELTVSYYILYANFNFHICCLFRHSTSSRWYLKMWAAQTIRVKWEEGLTFFACESIWISCCLCVFVNQK